MVQTCKINTCQTASNEYGTTAGVTWGFAPSNVQTWWTANGCEASHVATLEGGPTARLLPVGPRPITEAPSAKAGPRPERSLE
jgi:hypothetical protein